MDLDYCTRAGAGSLRLRLCRICTSEEDKVAYLLGLSSHQREKWWQQLKEAEFSGAHIHEHTLLRWPRSWPERPPCSSLPQSTCSPCCTADAHLFQLRPADASSQIHASRSMPTCFSHLVPHVLVPSIRLIVSLSPAPNHVSSGLAQRDC